MTDVAANDHQIEVELIVDFTDPVGPFCYTAGTRYTVSAGAARALIMVGLAVTVAPVPA